MTEKSDKWVLDVGIHNGTLTSRDSTTREFNSEAEALNSFRDDKKWYASIGYVIWFAYLTSPDGNQRTLEQNSNYY